jgi:Zn-dependent protease with chaperone function
MIWTESSEHTSIKKARETINTFIMPSVPQEQKELLTFIKENITPASQNFIFKHELGHTANNYSLKRIALTGTIMAMAVFIGISTAVYLAPLTGTILASLLGTTIGSISDLILSILGNAIFKYKQEKEADRFAACYSTPEEINAAAELFEKHQDFLDSTMSKLDRFYTITKYISGNFDGKERATFLRNLAKQKN